MATEAETASPTEEPEMSEEARRLWQLAQSPENQAFVKTAPPPSTWTAEQTLTLRRLWNQPGRAA
jgi:hypothetical protein